MRRLCRAARESAAPDEESTRARRPPLRDQSRARRIGHGSPRGRGRRRPGWSPSFGDAAAQRKVYATSSRLPRAALPIWCGSLGGLPLRRTSSGSASVSKDAATEVRQRDRFERYRNARRLSRLSVLRRWWLSPPSAGTLRRARCDIRHDVWSDLGPPGEPCAGVPNPAGLRAAGGSGGPTARRPLSTTEGSAGRPPPAGGFLALKRVDHTLGVLNLSRSAQLPHSQMRIHLRPAE